MQKLVFTNGGGKTIDLTTGNFGITNWEGLSGVGLNIQTQQVPFQDGGVFLDALMEQREISVTVAIQDNNDLSLRYELKRQLISALNPKLGEGVLVYTNDYLSRQIKAVPQLPIFENKNSNDAGTLKASVVFSCPSPYWEDLEDVNEIVEENKIPFLENNGDVNANVKMEIIPISNVVNPKIENLTTQKSIEYNDTIVAGQRVEINTNAGEKTCKLGEVAGEETTNIPIFLKVIYSERLGLFFGISENVLYKSKDGKDWESINYNCLKRLYNIIELEEAERIYIMGYGFLAMSSDGENWIISETNISENITITSVSFSPSLGLYVGSAWSFTLGWSRLLTSSDGQNWTTISNNANFTQINSIIWVDDLAEFIAVGDDGDVVTSSDGQNWVSQTSPSGQYKKIIYAENLQLLIATTGGAIIVTSSDGENWSASTIISEGGITDITYSRLTQEIICSSKLSGISLEGSISRSTDGINWENQNTSYYINTVAISYTLGSFAFGNNYDSESPAVPKNVIFCRPDKTSNFAILKEYDYASFTKIKYLNNSYFAVSRKILMKSKDLKNWERIYFTRVDLNDIEYSPSLDLYILISNKQIFGSSDGINWESIDSTEAVRRTIFYCEQTNCFYIGGASQIFRSSDGENWESTELQGANANVETIAYSPNLSLFVLCAGNKIYTSSDGINWSYAITWASFSQIIYCEERQIFVGVGRGGGGTAYVGISSDGVNWTTGTLPSFGYDVYILYSVTYSLEFSSFIAISGNVALISSDGLNWSLIDFVIGRRIINNKNDIVFVNESSIFKLSVVNKINVIQNLSVNSDMTFNLKIGTNQIKTSSESGSFNLKISYRQKYIGV